MRRLMNPNVWIVQLVLSTCWLSVGASRSFGVEAVLDEPTTAAEARFKVQVQENVMIPMRDGTELATNLFVPVGEGKFPTIIMRTPYGKGDANNAQARAYVERGYTFVVQDCRGTGRSKGTWEPGVHEPRDGVDTLSWVLAQPWCNGKLATAGGSYVGYTQWALAPEAGDELLAMSTVVPLFDWYESAYIGGTLQLQTMMGWGTMMTHPAAGQKSPIDPTAWNWERAFRYLPLASWDEQIGVEVPYLRAWIAHPTFDSYWMPSRIIDKLDRVRAANLTVSGWYDLFVQQALQHIDELRRTTKSERARDNQFLIVGPWGHGPNAIVGKRDYGSSASIEFDQLQQQWFDHWLKEDQAVIDSWAPLRIFVMGRNEWRDEQQWPLERTRWTQYFLHSNGQANTSLTDGTLNTQKPQDETADQFVYDPENPVPTLGGALLLGPGGSFDQTEIEQRSDVLVYTSDPLSEELEVTGPIRVILFAASDALDTDWTAKLVDVDPDGKAWNLCDGILRARYRKSGQQAELLEPGQIARYEIDLWSTSNVFLPGHRLRVEISSSNFPRFDRNPNTGHAFGANAELKTAHQTIYHDASHPSHILLPIIPPNGSP